MITPRENAMQGHLSYLYIYVLILLVLLEVSIMLQIIYLIFKDFKAISYKF